LSILELATTGLVQSKIYYFVILNLDKIDICMLIGITGQIGAGKSTAAQILKSFGAAVIDADKIGHDVVNNNPSLLRKLVKAFGKSILTKSGNLNRKKLAVLAFESELSKDKLNRLVHPYLLRKLHRQIKNKSERFKIVVIDAALLLDWNLDKDMDLNLVIHTSRKRRLEFLKKRGITRRDALARESRQLKYAEYRKRADTLIFNNSTQKMLVKKLEIFWNDKVLKTLTCS